jgi:hypothetical protein
VPCGLVNTISSTTQLLSGQVGKLKIEKLVVACILFQKSMMVQAGA